MDSIFLKVLVEAAWRTIFLHESKKRQIRTQRHGTHPPHLLGQQRTVQIHTEQFLHIGIQTGHLVDREHFVDGHPIRQHHRLLQEGHAVSIGHLTRQQFTVGLHTFIHHASQAWDGVDE